MNGVSSTGNKCSSFASSPSTRRDQRYEPQSEHAATREQLARRKSWTVTRLTLRLTAQPTTRTPLHSQSPAAKQSVISRSTEAIFTNAMHTQAPNHTTATTSTPATSTPLTTRNRAITIAMELLPTVTRALPKQTTSRATWLVICDLDQVMDAPAGWGFRYIAWPASQSSQAVRWPNPGLLLHASAS
jgi:hypothetical protein